MVKLKVLLYVIGVVQIILGIGYLFFPVALLSALGHSVPPADIQYPLGMLASRFLVYGVVLLIIAKAPSRHLLWLDAMVMIQLIDLGAGVFYTLTGIVSLGLSAFPMFNATLFVLLLLWWRPRREQMELASAARQP